MTLSRVTLLRAIFVAIELLLCDYSPKSLDRICCFPRLSACGSIDSAMLVWDAPDFLERPRRSLVLCNSFYCSDVLYMSATAVHRSPTGGRNACTVVQSHRATSLSAAVRSFGGGDAKRWIGRSGCISDAAIQHIHGKEWRQPSRATVR